MSSSASQTATVRDADDQLPGDADARKKARGNAVDNYSSRILAAAAYMVSAVTLLLLNKALAITFPFTFTVLIIQSLFTIVLNGTIVLVLWRYYGIKPYIFSWSELFQFLPVVAFFLLILFTGFEVLKFVSVITFVSLRYLSCFTSFFGEVLLLGKPFQWQLVPSLFVIVTGGIVYGSSDLEFNTIGYVLILINITSHSGFSLYIKWLDTTRNYSVYIMSLYTNGLSLIFTVALAFVAGDLPHKSLTALGEMSTSSAWILICSGVGGWAISTAGFWANSLFSSTAWTVQSSLNKIPTMFLSVLLFGTKISLGMYIGLTITMLGGLAFPLTAIHLEQKDAGYVKLSDEDPEPALEAAPSSAAPQSAKTVNA